MIWIAYSELASDAFQLLSPWIILGKVAPHAPQYRRHLAK
jgi:hypothetical protein